MASLSDIISNAKSQFKTNTDDSKRTILGTSNAQLSSAKREIQGIVPGIIANKSREVNQGITQSISKGIDGIKGAASDIIHGNFAGGIEKLTQSPSDVMAGLSKTFGLSTGSKLSNPGGVAPANSLEGAMARSDPQLSFNWYAELPVVTPVGGQSVELPWYYIEESGLPFRTFEAVPRFYQGRQQHYPGPYSVDALRLSVYADTSNVALAYLNAWQGAMLKPFKSSEATQLGGGYGRPVNYKKSIFIHLLSADKQMLCTFEYTECWPTTIDPYSMNSASSDRIVNHVNFSCGDVFITFSKVSNTSAAGFTPFFSSAMDLLDNATSGLFGA